MHLIIKNSRLAQKICNKLFKKENYLVLRPSPNNIGHIIQEIAIAASICKRDKKILVLLKPKKKINKHIFDICSHEIKILRKNFRIIILIFIFFFLDNLLFIKNLFSRILKIININFSYNPYPICLGFEEQFKNYIKIIGANFYYDSIIFNQKPKFYFSKNNKEPIFEKLNINENNWYVCVSMRDEIYNSKDIKRDSNINSYKKVFDYINSLGGKVIRIGKNVKKISSDLNLIDYANLDYANDYNDIVLVEKCRLYIGSNSGLSMLPLLFNKPSIMTNMNDYVGAFFLHNLCTLGKNYYSGKKRLTDFEIVNSVKYFDFIYKNYSFEKITDTDPDLLLEVVKEFLKFGRVSLDLKKNREFSRILNLAHKNILDNENLISDSFKDYLLGIKCIKSNFIFKA